MKYFVATKSVCHVSLLVVILLFVAASSQAQVRHELIRGDMPPGLAADYSRFSNPALAHYVQPVRIVGPQGSRIELATQGGFMETNASKVTVGMQIGPVYRLKVSNIPESPGKELFPSVEILN